MNNVGSKIFVFFLAFLLWLFIVTGRNYVIETDIPLRIYEPRTDHMLAEKVPDKISVRVGGSGRGVLLMNLFNKGSLILDIGNITKDQRISLKNYFEQRPNQVVLADNITFHEIIFPDSIDIIVDRKIEREVPIRINANITPSAGFVLHGNFRTFPDSVQLVGPDRILQTLDYVKTQKLDMENVNYSINEEVGLINPSPDFIRIMPDNIRLKQEIDVIGERVIRNVSINARNVPEDISIDFVPSSVDVTITGGNTYIQRIGSEDLTVYFDYLTQWLPQKQVYNLRTDIPETILDVKRIDPSDVEVVIVKKDSK